MEAKDLNDYKIEHLKMIQGVIDRMGRNSFQIRTWSVLLATGWLVFVAQGGTGALQSAILVVVPFLLLFALDGYYLWQERLNRRLHEEVRNKTFTGFSMGTDTLRRAPVYWRALTSPTVLSFHAAVIILVVLATPGVSN